MLMMRPHLLLHVRQAALGQQERALDKEVDHPLIEVPVVLLDRLERLLAGRVRNDDVELAEFGFVSRKSVSTLSSVVTSERMSSVWMPAA